MHSDYYAYILASKYSSTRVHPCDLSTSSGWPPLLSRSHKKRQFDARRECSNTPGTIARLFFLCLDIETCESTTDSNSDDLTASVQTQKAKIK